MHEMIPSIVWCVCLLADPLTKSQAVVFPGFPVQSSPMCRELADYQIQLVTLLGGLWIC